MLVYISEDEWYPVFTLETTYDKCDADYEVKIEVSDEFYAAYLTALEQFDEMQDKILALKKLHKTKGKAKGHAS